MTSRGSAAGPDSESGVRRGGALAALLVVAAVAGACDHPFEPFSENELGPFSVFGYLDVVADTQWIRVMPVRQELLPGPEPIDAVVTLVDLGTGRVVELRDSLFRYTDARLEGAPYAHNFWTTVPIRPESTYRLRVVRSDGEETTALVETPTWPDVTLVYEDLPGATNVMEPGWVSIQTEAVLYAELAYTVWDHSVERPGSAIVVREQPVSVGAETWQIGLPGTSGFERLNRPPFSDRGRRELRIAVAGPEWPYVSGLSLTDLFVPGIVPTTVRNGVGSVLGVALPVIPLPLCIRGAPRADGDNSCDTVFDMNSASVRGTFTLGPCSDPRILPVVRLALRYPDGGEATLVRQADWDGTYRFDGIEPGTELFLSFDGAPYANVGLPSPAAGATYTYGEVTLPGAC